MEQTMKVFMEYAAAFEQTYVDDDWLRLARFFSEGATYEVRGGPLACEISGREAIFAGLKKSIDGLDRRCAERQLELIDGPDIVASGDGEELGIGWRVTYQYGEAPKVAFLGRSVFKIVSGMIMEMRDEYDERDMEELGAWMLEYGEGLDGSYV